MSTLGRCLGIERAVCVSAGRVVVSLKAFEDDEPSGVNDAFASWNHIKHAAQSVPA
jgi:hypothetical protein